MSNNNIYHTEDGLPFIEVDGTPLVFGALPPDPLFAAAPEFSTAFDIMPETEWSDNSLRGANIPIRNQRQFGSCAGQGSVTALAYAREVRGLKKHILSATFVYGLNNGGRDQGSSVGGCVNTVKSVGTCFDEQVPYNVIYKNQFPAAAYKTAKRFKAQNVYKISNFNEFCTALVLGFPCVSGIACGSNFAKGQLGTGGLAPMPDVIVGGHSMCHTGLKRIGNVWGIETQNSWGDGWGLGGFCYLQRGNFSPGLGWGFDVYAVIAAEQDPEDVDDDLDPIIIKT